VSCRQGGEMMYILVVLHPVAKICGVVSLSPVENKINYPTKVYYWHAGLPDFSMYIHDTKTGKMYQMSTKYLKYL
jgi:hypothetical protein